LARHQSEGRPPNLQKNEFGQPDKYLQPNRLPSDKYMAGRTFELDNASHVELFSNFSVYGQKLYASVFDPGH